ncbi:MAG: hypothetical protein WAU61_09640 [Smithella sp.]
MNVKGTAYITRKDTIIKTFGEERWNTFSAKLAAKDKYFNQTIMNITLIPLDKFIIFLDDVLKEFFNNDTNHYWKLGEKSAEFSLSQGGPYHSYLLTKDIKQLVESAMPKIWSTYFDGGTFTSRLENNVVHITISGLPTKHIYFEYLVMGYLRKAFTIFGKKAVEHRVRGFSLANNDIYYQFELS